MINTNPIDRTKVPVINNDRGMGLTNTITAVRWVGGIAFNQAEEQIYLTHDVYSGMPIQPRQFTDIDLTDVRLMLEQNFRISNVKAVEDAVVKVANDNRYNPLLDLWNECHKEWDGNRGHIARLLQFVGAKYGTDDESIYNIAALRLHMMAAIARQEYPGCKYDHMVILTGDQGIGKTEFVKRLGMENRYVNENLKTIQGKEGIEGIWGKAFVCLDELMALTRMKEVEGVKAFLTVQNDYYRRPYGRTPEYIPRRCIFWGTTNAQAFLRDETGGRRFLPIKCSKKARVNIFENEEMAAYEIRQAWGEAMECYKELKITAQGPELILPKDIETTAEALRESVTEEDPKVGLIQDYLDTTNEPIVCAPLLYEKALLLDARQMGRKESNDIHTVMRHKIKGWHQIESASGKVRCGEYGPQICYARDEDGSEKQPLWFA